MNIPIILSAISLCIVVFSFFFFRWYITRKTAVNELPAYRTEVNQIIANIDAATDRDLLLVEERIKTLKKLMEDTDRRISVYMRELQRSRDGETMYTNLGRGIRAALDSRPPQLELPLEETKNTEKKTTELQRADNEQQPPTPHSLLPIPPQESSQEASSRKRGTKKPKLKMQIAELAAQGIPPQKIASRLKLSIAEVELALNLLHRNSHD